MLIRDGRSSAGPTDPGRRHAISIEKMMLREAIFLNLANCLISAVAAAFALGRKPAPSVRKPSVWFATSWLLLAIAYAYKVAVFAVNVDPHMSDYQCVPFIFAHLASIFCVGVLAFVAFPRKHLAAERTLFTLLAGLTLVALIVDLFPLAPPKDILRHNIASVAAGVAAYAALSWFLRHDHIGSSMVFLAYACLQVPAVADSAGNVHFDFAVLVTAKVSAIGAMYKSFDVLQERYAAQHEKQPH